jgi:2,3-bisphosphoglycerate-dependent phosphoglycerate mutase
MQYPSLLVLVRHGETFVNKERGDEAYIPEGNAMLSSTPDHLTLLTPEGERQAEETGFSLRKTFGAFDCVMDSGYRRTQTTRKRLVSAYSDEELTNTVIVHILLREKERGYTFNMTGAEALLNFPWLEKYLRTTGIFYSRPPGGESHADLCLRVGLLWREICELWAGKKVLLVTHGHTIRAFRYHLEHLSPSQYEQLVAPGQVMNCGVFAYRYCEQSNAVVPELTNAVCWQRCAV